MTPDQKFFLLGGAIILFVALWGVRFYLSYRKKIRLKEISSLDAARILESIDLGRKHVAEAHKNTVQALSRQA